MSSCAQSLDGLVNEPIAAKSVEISSSTPNPLQGMENTCDLQYPYPKANATNKNPYADSGIELCQRLVVRGRRMQCEIESLVQASPKNSTTGSKIEVASWAKCNGKIAQMLVDGYYFPASEIERRLDLCSSNYYADPGSPPKFSLYQKIMNKWYPANDLAPVPSDEVLELAIKKSTPLDSNQYQAGLMKCEWMVARGKAPYIDPLPGGSMLDESNKPSPNGAQGFGVKKMPKKKISQKTTS